MHHVLVLLPFVAVDLVENTRVTLLWIVSDLIETSFSAGTRPLLSDSISSIRKPCCSNNFIRLDLDSSRLWGDVLRLGRYVSKKSTLNTVRFWQSHSIVSFGPRSPSPLDGRGDERDDGGSGRGGGGTASANSDVETVASSDGSNVYGNSIISIVLNLTDFFFVIFSMLLDSVIQEDKWVRVVMCVCVCVSLNRNKGKRISNYRTIQVTCLMKTWETMKDCHNTVLYCTSTVLPLHTRKIE